PYAVDDGNRRFAFHAWRRGRSAATQFWRQLCCVTGKPSRPGELHGRRGTRARLGNEWGQFAPAVQNECTQLSSMKGFQSYVELLTCLQTTQDAKKLPTQQ
ncbi:MAG: hypothetical protein WBX35_17385, partial [Pseudolabrys sp.]